jgi:hypothetical protein
MRALLSICLLALCACSAAPPAPPLIAAPAPDLSATTEPKASKKKIDTFAKLYFGCIDIRLFDLDDGVSDPSSVALAAMGACMEEQAEYLNVMLEGTPTAIKEDVRRSQTARWVANQLPIVTALVLKHRAAVRAKPAPAPKRPSGATSI